MASLNAGEFELHQAVEVFSSPRFAWFEVQRFTHKTEQTNELFAMFAKGNDPLTMPDRALVLTDRAWMLGAIECELVRWEPQYRPETFFVRLPDSPLIAPMYRGELVRVNRDQLLRSGLTDSR